MINIPYEFQRLASLLAALIIAFLVYRLTKDVSVQKDTTKRLTKYAEGVENDIFQRTGERIIDRFGLSFAAWEKHLFWAQLGGYYEDWNTGMILGRTLIFGLFGLAYVVVLQMPPIMWIIVLMAVSWTPTRVSSRSKEVHKAVKRQLPEMASLIAAEVAAGSSTEQAIERVITFPGEMSQLLRRVVDGSRQEGRPMFSRDNVRGQMSAYFEEIGEPALIAFSSQMDLVANVGVEAPKLMASVANVFAAEYIEHIQNTAENLENQLLGPIVAGFFIPFLAAILLPLILPLMSAF
jgi:tight adherence protein C